MYRNDGPSGILASMQTIPISMGARSGKPLLIVIANGWYTNYLLGMISLEAQAVLDAAGVSPGAQ